MVFPEHLLDGEDVIPGSLSVFRRRPSERAALTPQFSKSVVLLQAVRNRWREHGSALARVGSNGMPESPGYDLE